MTKPRRKKAKPEKDIAVTACNSDQNDFPSRFRLITKIQQGMEERKIQKKLARINNKPIPKPTSSESQPPPTSTSSTSQKKTTKITTFDRNHTTTTKTNSHNNKSKNDKSSTQVSSSSSHDKKTIAKKRPISDKNDLTSSAKRRSRRQVEIKKLNNNEINDDNKVGIMQQPKRKMEFNELNDSIRFGEVVQAPPSLSISNKMKKRRLQKILAQDVAENAIKKSLRTQAQQRQLDEERTRMIEKYRELKAKKELERTFGSSEVNM